MAKGAVFICLTGSLSSRKGCLNDYSSFPLEKLQLQPHGDKAHREETPLCCIKGFRTQRSTNHPAEQTAQRLQASAQQELESHSEGDEQSGAHAQGRVGRPVRVGKS